MGTTIDTFRVVARGDQAEFDQLRADCQSQFSPKQMPASRSLPDRGTRTRYSRAPARGQRLIQRAPPKAHLAGEGRSPVAAKQRVFGCPRLKEVTAQRSVTRFSTATH